MTEIKGKLKVCDFTYGLINKSKKYGRNVFSYIICHISLGLNSSLDQQL